MSTTELAAVDRPVLPATSGRILEFPDRARTHALERSPRSVELPHMAVDAIVLLAAAASTVLAQGQARDVFGLALLAMLSLVLRGTYRPKLRQIALDGVVQGVISVALGGMAAYAFFSLLASSSGATAPAQTLLSATIVSAITVATGRVVLAHIQRVSRVQRHALRPVIIVGTGDVGRQIAGRLNEHPEYGLRPAGFVDADPFPLRNADDDELPPFIGGPTALEEALERTGARQVIFAFTTLADDGLMSLIRRCHALGVDVSVVPRFFDSMNER